MHTQPHRIVGEARPCLLFGAMRMSRQHATGRMHYGSTTVHARALLCSTTSESTAVLFSTLTTFQTREKHVAAIRFRVGWLPTASCARSIVSLADLLLDSVFRGSISDLTSLVVLY